MANHLTLLFDSPDCMDISIRCILDYFSDPLAKSHTMKIAYLKLLIYDDEIVKHDSEII